ncbi:unnamed protein product [Cuscuta europaea]|uniref:Uncharacterized protein n=1 Tax=Cuscuta europaea TaxID=41803 RepID=A0A9P0ZZY7_CUSEU|nr:unnamed protein product [Cuscuta europaea]
MSPADQQGPIARRTYRTLTLGAGRTQEASSWGRTFPPLGRKPRSWQDTGGKLMGTNISTPWQEANILAGSRRQTHGDEQRQVHGDERAKILDNCVSRDTGGGEQMS